MLLSARAENRYSPAFKYRIRECITKLTTNVTFCGTTKKINAGFILCRLLNMIDRFPVMDTKFGEKTNHFNQLAIELLSNIKSDHAAYIVIGNTFPCPCLSTSFASTT